jgi:hypothetical protein
MEFFALKIAFKAQQQCSAVSSTIKQTIFNGIGKK